MLTRYKQLYNALTHSEAFKAEGRMDNSKINKKKFTPHNLKALMIGGNGAIAFYYTTNDLDGKLVKPISINCPFVNKVTGQIEPQKYQEWVKEEKGMIDALIDGLKFNYIEEIVFFTGGFAMPEELSKEWTRVEQFCSSNKSMPRLMGIYAVEGNLSNDLCGFTVNKSLKQQMQEHNIPCQPLREYKPERTELGLLTNRGLDSSEYEMDKRFSPNLADKEKVKVDYRLSRYFYNQEQQAIKEKKRQEEEKKKIAEQMRKEEDKQKLYYIQQLKEQGYKYINDDVVIAGSNKMFSKVFNWLKQFCVEKPDNSTGYKYKTCYLNVELLKSKGVMNTKDANIWSPDIFTKDEDLRFRLFAKENALSFEILIKLPVDLNDFNFSSATVENIALIFSNKNREKGKLFQSSILNSPEIKSLKGAKGIDCPYDAVEITLVKDLMDFKNSSWMFADYLKACNGETTNFSTFKKLPLGNQIVVGVKPNSLKVETFDCSGVHQTSGIICGQAGSGKSALMDSLVVQFMALKGDMGNGSVILMDAKQEWPPLWREVLQEKGIPFYGFDGGLIQNQEDIKQQVIKKGTPQLENFTQPITQEVGGMIFVMTLYQVIQGILKKSGCKDIKTFNKANKNIDGITKLPRIAIFIDEMNTFSVNATRGTVARNILDLITGGANLTRTAGYMWFLCGQDVPKSIISSEKRGSFKYNIMGTMDRDRYEYFEVTENPAVVAYESKNATAEKPHPIMTQGTFYAGQKGNTELVRSMFLPDEGKGEALDLVNSDFEGMYELDRLVRYALDNCLFDKFTFGVGNKNNIIYAVLRDIGVISDSEFVEATNRVFGDTSSESILKGSEDVGLDENLEGVLNQDEDFSKPTNPATQKQDTQPKQEQKQDINRPIQTDAQAPNRPIRPQPSAQQAQPQRPIRPQLTEQQSTRPVRPQLRYKAYTGNLHVKDNPFRKYNTETNTGVLLSVKELTKIVQEDIDKVIGSTDLIKDFRVTQDGVLVFNNIAYMPQFEDSFIQSLPMTLHESVLNGQLVELFNLRKVFQFRNLTSLIIENEALAQGRARKEMGIGFRKRWSVIFKKFDYLAYVKVGQIEYARNNPDTNVEHGLLEKFKANPSSTYAPKGSTGFLDKVWDSKPVRVMTGALGWTAGVQATWLLASLLGPWGLLFGALAMAGAYKEVRNSPAGQRYAEDRRLQKQLELEKAKARNQKKPTPTRSPNSQGRQPKQGGSYSGDYVIDKDGYAIPIKNNNQRRK